MYARSTTVRGNPQAMNDGIAYVRDKVMPAVSQMDGCVGLSMLCDRDSGRCIVTTAWADADALHRSAEGVMAMRAKAAEIMQGETEVNEWEIAILHRLHETHHGACARVTWSRADAGRADQLLDMYRTSLLPRIQEMPGFCSCRLLIDREDGRAVGTVVFDAREHLAQTREQARMLRDEGARILGIDVLDVAEMDLVLAHLRVPETV